MLGQPFTLPGQVPAVAGTKLCHLLADEGLLRRLSGNTSEDCVSALRSLNLPDSFWTDEFKVVPCAKTYSHKWTLCPCAHIGETARRRCPRTLNYKAVLCPLVKAKKTCPLGDNCSYAHNVFEHWLHPSRYKTRLCSFGRNCNRSICFFAHSAEELRCVPCTDDKEGDEREYLMQILMAQENGLLPATALEPVPQAPMPQLLPGMLPDLSAVLQQALQQPLPPSTRSSINGMPPDAAAMMSARQSMNGVAMGVGVNDLMSGRGSMSGLQHDSAAAAMFRGSMSGALEGPAAAMMRARASMNGLPERSSTFGPSARGSMNGLSPDGGSGGFPRARPSLNGLPDNAAASAMLLSMSMHSMQQHQGSMQRAMSNDLNLGVGGAPGGGMGAMGAAMSGPLHTAAAMQHALSGDLNNNSGQLTAAAIAMERAYSRELSAGAALGVGVGSISPVQPIVGGSGPSSGPLDRYCAVRRDMSLGPAQSINSVESDSLIQVRGGAGGGIGALGAGAASGSAVLGGYGPCGALGFEALGHPQAPARLSDPGSSFQMAMPGGVAGIASHHARVSESGNKLGMLSGKDLQGLESLLPLVNNALATGALGLPPGAVGGNGGGGMRRSNSGSNQSGRGQSPPLQEQFGAVGSPSHSGSLTPLSSNSAVELGGGMDGLAAAGATTAGSPQRAPEGVAAFEGMYMAAAAASGATNLSMHQLAGGGAGGVDQSYLNNLVARLQDQGVNKDQLVSSLSQLLAQLLSVS